jgi:hypothetical protein
MVKLTHPIPILDRKNYYFVTYSELRLNLNSVSSSVQSGVDSNWTFFGIGKKIGKNSSFETGYLLDYNRKVNTPDTFVHALLFSLNYSAPQLIRRDKKADATEPDSLERNL